MPPSPEPLGSETQTRRPANVLLYNPLWMDSTFRSRTTTEALLSPQREAGNLTPHDYDNSIAFLTNYHRQYPILFALAGTAFIFPFRNPKWPQFKSAAASFTFGFGGYAAGKIAFLNAHLNYLRSIENPHGFQKAMENIQAQIGSPKGGIVVERVYELSPDDMEPDQYSNVSQIILPKPSDNAPEPLVPTARTKWDEIRAANSRSASNSSWDKLRQGHERKDIKSNIPRESLWGDESTEKVDIDPYDNHRSRTG